MKIIMLFLYITWYVLMICLLNELLGGGGWYDNIFQPVLPWFIFLWPRLTRRGRELEQFYDFEVAPELETDAEAAGLDEYDLLLLRHAAVERWLNVERSPWLAEFAERQSEAIV